MIGLEDWQREGKKAGHPVAWPWTCFQHCAVLWSELRLAQTNTPLRIMQSFLEWLNIINSKKGAS